MMRRDRRLTGSEDKQKVSCTLYFTTGHKLTVTILFADFATGFVTIEHFLHLLVFVYVFMFILQWFCEQDKSCVSYIIIYIFKSQNSEHL